MEVISAPFFVRMLLISAPLSSKKELLCILNNFCLTTILDRLLRPLFETSKKCICAFICLHNVNLNLLFVKH